MKLNRYEHVEIRDKIYGYMIPSVANPLETKKQEFERAKEELILNLSKLLKNIENFTFDDYISKIK